MSYRCQKCGKKRSIGMSVSHSNRKTKRPFKPNLITKKIFDKIKGKLVTVKICARCLKTHAKGAN